MNIDSYYEMGAGHTFCQDYCLSGQVGEVSYLVGSDGCSASKDTDIGARVLCHLTKKRIIKTVCELIPLTDLSIMTLQVHLLDMLNLFKETLALPSSAFDATLFIVIEYKGKCLVLGWGDGVVIEKKKSGATKIYRIEYTSGAPFYLSYFLDPKRREEYERQFSEDNVNHKTWELIAESSSSWDDDYRNDTIFVRLYDSEELDLIAICSDGLTTYQSDKDCIDTAIRYTNYKNFAGDFVKRRMNKIKKENKIANSFHYDDIFCATIKFEEESIDESPQV